MNWGIEFCIPVSLKRMIEPGSPSQSIPAWLEMATDGLPMRVAFSAIWAQGLVELGLRRDLLLGHARRPEAARERRAAEHHVGQPAVGVVLFEEHLLVGVDQMLALRELRARLGPELSNDHADLLAVALTGESRHPGLEHPGRGPGVGEDLLAVALLDPRRGA
jgi:hypothetical protein